MSHVEKLTRVVAINHKYIIKELPNIFLKVEVVADVNRTNRSIVKNPI